MKHLYLLRGAPGAGKTTLVEQFGLSQFTLSADGIRKMFGNTDYNISYADNGEVTVKESIQWVNDGKVWETLKGMLENRMIRGETTIIDATHSNLHVLQGYNKLINKYKYRVFTIQLDIPIEQVLEQNRMRPEALRIPDNSVLRKQEQLDQTTSHVPKKYGLRRFSTIDEAGKFILQNSTWRTKVIDPNQYENVYLIGDVHASYDVLNQFLTEHYSDKNYYIFMGDYLDRGLKPYETITVMDELQNKDNVVLLRGNHELNYENWLNIPKAFTDGEIANGRLKQAKIDQRREDVAYYTKKTRSSMKYIKEVKATVTADEFNDFKRKLRNVMNSTQDIFRFSVNGQHYVCTHGGIVANGLDFRGTGSTINLSSEVMVKGNGTYDDDIDDIFTKQMMSRPEQDRIIQVHGHRNTFKNGVMAHKYSYNLEQGITDGGLLGILKVNATTGEVTDLSLKNEGYRVTMSNTEINKYPISKFFADARENENLKVKALSTVEDVYSVNFTEKAFRDKVWTDMTVRARGLFINPVTEKVVARSYDKFFNMGERGSTSKHVLGKKLDFPVTVSSKTNGFLGIVTVYEGEFLFLSKSTDDSTFSKLFKDTFLTHAKELGVNLGELKEFISKNDVSVVFEVIDQVKDPHIIKYEKKQGVVLLDVFKNQLGEETLDKHLIPELYGFPCPEERIFNEWEELREYIHLFNKGVNLRSNPTISGLGEELDPYNEGFVMTDASGFRVKVKGEFYGKWKSMRPIIHQRLKGKRGEARNRLGAEFLHFLINERKEGLTLNVLDEREAYVAYMEKFDLSAVLSK